MIASSLILSGFIFHAEPYIPETYTPPMPEAQIQYPLGPKAKLYTDRFGNTTGTINGKRVSCYTDRFGNTTCR